VLVVVAGGGGGRVVAAPVLHLGCLIGRRGLGLEAGGADADEVDGEFDSIRWVAFAFAFVARGKEGGKKKRRWGCFETGEVDVLVFSSGIFYSFWSVTFAVTV
jgi:hypothetical protein